MADVAGSVETTAASAPPVAAMEGQPGAALTNSGTSQQAAPDKPAEPTEPAAAPAAKQPPASKPAAAPKPSKPSDAKAASSESTTKDKPASSSVEFEPPAACIRRLLKQSLPKTTNISKDSLSAISRASGIFVLYLTTCANDVARESRRSTIVAKDVLAALKELEFEEFVPIMEKFLEGHRKAETSKKVEKERLKKLGPAKPKPAADDGEVRGIPVANSDKPAAAAGEKAGEKQPAETEAAGGKKRKADGEAVGEAGVAEGEAMVTESAEKKARVEVLAAEAGPSPDKEPAAPTEPKPQGS